MNLSQLGGRMLAAILPPMGPMKAPKGEVAYPGYRNQVEPRTSAISRTDRLLANADRMDARTLGSTNATMRELSKSSPDMAGSISFMQRTGIPENYTVIGFDMDGKVNIQGTQLAQELLRRMTFMGNMDGSFNPSLSLQSLSEQLALELQIYGSMGLEVALDKARIPSKFVPISTPTLKFYDEDFGIRIVQVVGGEEIDLDIPTFFYISVDQLQTDAYSSSYLESALQPILADIEFNNDLRRILKRHIMPRIVATIDGEKVKKLCPPQILQDPVKFRTYKNELLGEISNVLNTMNPEDAVVTYDSVSYDYLNADTDPAAIVERMQAVLNSKLSTGAKTLPVVLGHGKGSNASSTEALLYLKQANMIRVKLNELYSRALTIACRLMGQDIYVEFKYEHLDLRPRGELEAFKAMEQARLLEQLSLGLLTDEVACIMLTGNLPPAGFKPLSGTMFKSKSADTGGNPTSNTSAIEQSMDSDTPKETKSPQK